MSSEAATSGGVVERVRAFHNSVAQPGEVAGRNRRRSDDSGLRSDITSDRLAGEVADRPTLLLGALLGGSVQIRLDAKAHPRRGALACKRRPADPAALRLGEVIATLRLRRESVSDLGGDFLSGLSQLHTSRLAIMSDNISQPRMAAVGSFAADASKPERHLSGGKTTCARAAASRIG
jgi:hypothetical protein